MLELLEQWERQEIQDLQDHLEERALQDNKAGQDLLEQRVTLEHSAKLEERDSQACQVGRVLQVLQDLLGARERLEPQEVSVLQEEQEHKDQLDLWERQVPQER